MWWLIWRTRLGYIIRATGHSEKAAIYAQVMTLRALCMIAMAISGALAGLVALNEILGVQGRVILNFTSGYGFTGIAVALMGAITRGEFCLPAYCSGHYIRAVQSLILNFSPLPERWC